MSRPFFSALRASAKFVAAGILVAAIWWLTLPGMAPVDLGAADQLVGRPGAERFLLQGPDGWRVLTTSARSPDDALDLPKGIKGRPALASDGSVLALIGGALVVMAKDGEILPGPDMPPSSVGSNWELIGVDAADRPVLACETEAGRRLLVVETESEGWLQIATQGSFASPPSPADVLLSATRQALAYRGESGWEVWLFDDLPARRLVARQCSGSSAVFSPLGDALILDGRTDGIYRLEFESGQVNFMAKGNLGHSEFVPFSAGFRGDPMLMVAPVRDAEGYLQIVQTHLSGGGRYGISTGAVHHYGVTASHGGRFLAYCQASFDEDEGGTIAETLYLFDFEVGRAVFSFDRAGGQETAGPRFVGTAPTLVFVADGRALLLDPRDA